MEFQTFLVVGSIAVISAAAETALTHFGKTYAAKAVKVAGLTICGGIIVKIVSAIVLTAQTVMNTFSYF